MNSPADGRTGGELMPQHRLPRVTREEALDEYTKASELGLPESERRGIYPAAGCERHLERANADTDVHPVVDDRAAAKASEPVREPLPWAQINDAAAGGWLIAALVAVFLFDSKAPLVVCLLISAACMANAYRLNR